MNYDIIHMVRTHGEDGTGNDVPIMDVLKRLGRHRKKPEIETTKEMRNLQWHFRLLMSGECYGANFR